jgi:exodeoxyribonuclease VII small subunit
MAKGWEKSVGESGPPDPPPPEHLTFEQATAELEAIIERIESGEIGLEESLRQRQRGELLIRRCRAILDKAEQELEHVSAEETGNKGGKSRR